MLFCNVYKFKMQVVIYVFKHLLSTYYRGCFRTFKDYKNTLLSFRGMVYTLFGAPLVQKNCPHVLCKRDTSEPLC